MAQQVKDPVLSLLCPGYCCGLGTTACHRGRQKKKRIKKRKNKDLDGGKLHNIGLSNDFLDDTKSKNRQVGHQTKNYIYRKETMNGMKRQPTER